MSRALLTFERTPAGGWRPTVAWLGTPRRLEAKALPGDARRDRWVAAVRDQATPPLAGDTPGTWEDWVGWAVGALSNGHDSWAVEVQPELTVQQVYEREVLRAEQTPLGGPPGLRPSAEVPADLGGYKRVKPA